MADDALLSDLCSICNAAKFKYRCPGCAARTCSLPCYKRHQHWAQCTGKRDPTRFMKKSELATPAGIDHDFNFLTSIERGLEQAERQMHIHGLGSPSDPRHNANVRPPSDQHFAVAGVTVIRAPKGLTRQKENKTHRNKSGKNTVWTVEWIYEDATRILTQTSSAQSLLASQPFGRQIKREAARKRKREDDQSVPKSERDQQHASSALENQNGTSEVASGQAGPEPPFGGISEPERVIVGTPVGKSIRADTATTRDGKAHTADDARGSICGDGPEPKPVPPEYSFYLLKPRTSSKQCVLIRLEAAATLGECLRGRTVLEFPTVYVFPKSTTPPPEKFMLEVDYLHQEGEEQKELEDLLKHVNPQTLSGLEEERGSKVNDASDNIDGDRILDVLKQDIGTGV